jgi:hypothetical protein
MKMKDPIPNHNPASDQAEEEYKDNNAIPQADARPIRTYITRGILTFDSIPKTDNGLKFMKHTRDKALNP